MMFPRIPAVAPGDVLAAQTIEVPSPPSVVRHIGYVGMGAPSRMDANFRFPRETDVIRDNYAQRILKRAVDLRFVRSKV